MLKKKPFEIIVKLLKQRLENLNDKNNRVIKLFIKLYKNIKIPLELNNNNKKIIIKPLNSMLTNLYSKEHV